MFNLHSALLDLHIARAAKDHAAEFTSWQRLNEMGHVTPFPFSLNGTNALSLCDGAD